MAEVTQASQQFVKIKEIRDGIVYLKNGGLRQVLIVSGINFELKSEGEQGAILANFQRFLNSLDFGIQFFIHSRKVNIARYLANMEEHKKEETNELLRVQIEEYINFVRNFIEENAIINKNFFVIVPYDPVSLPSGTKGILGLFGKKHGAAEHTKDTTEGENTAQLKERATQVMEGLAAIDLRAVPLENEELIELFYNLYNPQIVDKKGVVV